MEGKTLKKHPAQAHSTGCPPSAATNKTAGQNARIMGASGSTLFAGRAPGVVATTSRADCPLSLDA
jgi:hypothetical protein